jgi:hypothetical protein
MAKREVTTRVSDGDDLISAAGIVGGVITFVACMAAVLFGSAGRAAMWVGFGGAVVALAGFLHAHLGHVWLPKRTLRGWQRALLWLLQAVCLVVLLPAVVVAFLLMMVVGAG